MNVKKRYLILGGVLLIFIAIYTVLSMDSFTGPDDRDLYPTMIPLAQEENGFYDIAEGLKAFSSAEHGAFNDYRELVSDQKRLSNPSRNKQELEATVEKALEDKARVLMFIKNGLKKPYQDPDFFALQNTKNHEEFMIALSKHLHHSTQLTTIRAIFFSEIWTNIEDKNYQETQSTLESMYVFLVTKLSQPTTTIDSLITLTLLSQTIDLTNKITLYDPNFSLSPKLITTITQTLPPIIEQSKKNFIKGEYYMGKHGLMSIFGTTKPNLLKSLGWENNEVVRWAHSALSPMYAIYLQKNNTLKEWHTLFMTILSGNEASTSKLINTYATYENKPALFVLQKNGLGKLLIVGLAPRLLDSFGESQKNIETKLSVLTTSLAIQKYKKEQGKLPEALSDLVPHYLPQLPLDLYSPKDTLIYNKQFGAVYSIGSNGMDDGGPEKIKKGQFSREDILMYVE